MLILSSLCTKPEIFRARIIDYINPCFKMELIPLATKEERQVIHNDNGYSSNMHTSLFSLVFHTFNHSNACLPL